MLPSHTPQRVALDGQLPKPDSGIGENGHCKGRPSEELPSLDITPIMRRWPTARHANCSNAWPG